MNTTLFGNKQRAGAGIVPTTPLDTLIQGIQQQVNANGSRFASTTQARAAISLESIDVSMSAELEQCVGTLSTALENICNDMGIGQKLTKAQRDAAVVAGVVAGDINGFIHAPIKRDVVATENVGYISPQGSEYFESRMRPALEAYDEKENKNAVVYSIAYNMQAARQDEFGEAFFPTVVVTPDQVGFGISIRLISVYNEVRRQISGNLDSFNKVNIIKAVTDPTILKNDELKIVPVFRDESKAHFVDETLVAPRDVLLEGETITTQPLGMGKKFSLLAISQTDALLDTGLQDATDSIDTALQLEALYMKIGSGGSAEVVKFNTSRLPTATFTYSVQGNTRLMNLAFTTNSLLVNKNVKKVDGSASTILASLVSGQYSVRLAVDVSGSVNLELANTNVYSGNVTVISVTDVDGVALPLTSGTGATIAALFGDAIMVGYDLDARRTNANRRMRGQLLDTTYYNQVYAVPLRSPITIPRPLNAGDANDSSDLSALITATHIRTSNGAVDELLRVKDVLAEYVTNVDNQIDSPDILGVSRFLVTPFYEHANLDVDSVIDSIKSHERAADIQAVLVNKLRDMAYRMYRDSNYKAAADALAGGMSAVPTVIIGTDPVLARYLTVTGDFRTLANEFNVKVVSTLNKRMTGKIIITFGVFDGGMDGVPNPMHFGNMAWKPELTLVLPLHRNGANSKELTVQPSFLHVAHLPIMASLEVTGISDVVASKVAINMTTVP